MYLPYLFDKYRTYFAHHLRKKRIVAYSQGAIVELTIEGGEMAVPRSDRGELTFEPDSSGLRSGLVGSAPNDIPYWPLQDLAGEPWGRLGIMFAQEEIAVSKMRDWFKKEHGDVLPYGIPRRLRNVEIQSEAEVFGLHFNLDFWLWCQRVTTGFGLWGAPAALLAGEFDVLRVGVDLHPGDFEYVIITEDALARGRVVCSEGPTVVLRA
jgi:hypothetical protein